MKNLPLNAKKPNKSIQEQKLETRHWKWVRSIDLILKENVLSVKNKNAPVCQLGTALLEF